MKYFSKFNTDRKGNQVHLSVTKGTGYEQLGECVLHEEEGRLTFKMDNPDLFAAFFHCGSLVEVIQTATEQNWNYLQSNDSPLSTGVWK